MTLLSQIRTHWLRYQTIRLAPWEQLIMRIGIAAVTWLTLSIDTSFPSQPHPNGIAQWIDLTPLASEAIVPTLRIAIKVSLITWILGLPAAISLLLPCWIGIAWFSLKNSQGAIGHSFQAIHLCLLAAWTASLWSLIAHWKKHPLPQQLTPSQFTLNWATQALAAGYVVSAITKLLISGGLWFKDSQYFALHLIKNNDMKFYGTLEESNLRLHWLPDLMMQYPLLSQLFFGLALPLELLAFLGCWNRRLALLFGLGLIGFHYGVKLLTQLDFEANVQLLWILMVNPLWWIWQAIPQKIKKHLL
jgi:hypothetical protein